MGVGTQIKIKSDFLTTSSNVFGHSLNLSYQKTLFFGLLENPRPVASPTKPYPITPMFIYVPKDFNVSNVSKARIKLLFANSETLNNLLLPVFDQIDCNHRHPNI